MSDSKSGTSPGKAGSSPRPVRLKRQRYSQDSQDSTKKSPGSTATESSAAKTEHDVEKVKNEKNSETSKSADSGKIADPEKGDRVMDSLLRGFVATKMAMIEEERKQRLKLLKEQTIKEEDGLYDGLVVEVVDDDENASRERSRHKKDKKKKDKKEKKKDKDKDRDHDKKERHKHKHRSRSRSKDRKYRSRSRSRGRRSRSRSRSRDRRRSRSRSKDRKRHSRSRSKERRNRSRSRSKDRNRNRSRSRDRNAGKSKGASYSKENSHDRSRSHEAAAKKSGGKSHEKEQKLKTGSRSRSRSPHRKSPHDKSPHQSRSTRRSKSPSRKKSPRRSKSPHNKSPHKSKSPRRSKSPQNLDKISKFLPRHSLNEKNDDEPDFVSRLTTNVSNSRPDGVPGKTVPNNASAAPAVQSTAERGKKDSQQCDISNKVSEVKNAPTAPSSATVEQKPSRERKASDSSMHGVQMVEEPVKSEPIRPVIEHTKTVATFSAVEVTSKHETVKEEVTTTNDQSAKPLPKPAAILKEFIEKSASQPPPSPVRAAEPKPSKLGKISIGRIGESKLSDGGAGAEAPAATDAKPDASNAVKKEDGDGASGKKPVLKLGVKITESSAAFIQLGMRVDQKTGKTYEDGEISDSADAEGDSEDDGEVGDSDAEDGSGKKRKKHKHKHRKKRHKNSKDGADSKKHRSASHRSRSRSPRKRRHSKSRSKSRSPDRRGRKSRSRSRDREKRRRRSRSRDRYDDGFWGRERPWRRSRSPERKSSASTKEGDLRVKIDKAKLRKIAIANAFANMQSGQGPPVELKPDMLASMKAGGHSIEDLTKFCQKIARKEGDPEVSDSLSDSMSGSDGEDAPFINHPFKLRDIQPNIVMNIRNAKQIPIMTPADKAAASSTLRLQFPVSSGSQHRNKEGEWVPVEKKTAAAALPPPPPPPPAAKASPPSKPVARGAYGSPLEADTTPPAAAKPAPTPPPENPQMPGIMAPPAIPAPIPEAERVFPSEQSQGPSINIGELVSARLTAMRQLQANPYNVEAISKMHHAQKQMTAWAQSKELPGQFTGSTGAQILTPQQLAGPDPRFQAWAKKDTLIKAAPVKSGIGMALLQKMGWKQGEGLGKNKDGSQVPLMLEVKSDRKGLSSEEDKPAMKNKSMQQKAPTKIVTDLSTKHPVSALVELCTKRKWGAPSFILVQEEGPDHKKEFIFKVKVNSWEFQPTISSNNKKQAKSQAASVCLQELGLIPR